MERKNGLIALVFRIFAAASLAGMLAACTPTGDEQNGLIEPQQERGPYAPFLG